jgi:hypothetical protein
MSFFDEKASFDANGKIYDRALITFKGAESYDVYNCSAPFTCKGKRYIFGRVERRADWARSRAFLFSETGKDEFTFQPGGAIYPMEDPFITPLDGELWLGGVHVRFRRGEINSLYTYFYRGNDPADMVYYTTGPDGMKDIRLVQLPQGVGVFSRPNGRVGFTIVPRAEELTAEVIAAAPLIKGLFEPGEWGGCNQCFLLDGGLIGVIGHNSAHYTDEDGVDQSVYVNISFVFNPSTYEAMDRKIIGTRESYPSAPYKLPNLKSCAFTSGIAPRDDGKVDLYSGLSDAFEGRITIDYPFAGYGQIIGGGNIILP